MKRIILITVILLLLLAILSGCAVDNVPAGTPEPPPPPLQQSSPEPPQPQQNPESKAGDPSPAEYEGEKISVIATFFAPFDFARTIAGQRADVTMLLPPGSESHSFEPSPQDIINIMNSDVFIYVGGDSDEWVGRILDSMDTSEMTIVSLMESASLLVSEVVEGMQDHDDGGHGHHHHDEEEDDDEFDEHVWTSPRNSMMIVEAICDALCLAALENSEYFRQNTSVFLEELTNLDSAFRAVVDSAARRTLVFGDRFPFRYFAAEYGLDYFAAFPGCSTETEPSVQTVAFLIGKVRSEQIPVVFHIELSNERMADTISEETGAVKMLLHSAHNISRTDFQNGVTYLDVMARNVEALRAALW